MKVSVITVCLNAESRIFSTLYSISSQKYRNIEHIIVDGNSSDRTLEYINDFVEQNKSTNCRVISENDSGIYDAMNKGITLATGNLIGILNAGDIYENENIIEKVVESFESSTAVGIYGDLYYVSELDYNKIIRFWKSGHMVLKKIYKGWMPPHPTMFLTKEAYDVVGKYNTSLRISSDYEFCLRLFLLHNMKLQYLPQVLVRMVAGGESNRSISNRIQANLEDRKSWENINLKPFFYTLWLKPISKLKQFWKRKRNY